MLGIFKENTAVQKLIRTRYEVIFYAENAYYFQYFSHLFEAMQSAGKKTCYITSDKNDPVFEKQGPNTDVVFSKSTLAFAFDKLQADVVIMTMPDLGNFIFKKSAGVKKYVYVFHALVSTHQQYREGAFDHYDTIFMAGPHHEAELREAETLANSIAKDLVSYGYPLLEQIAGQKNLTPKRQILIAPSWYEEGILQTCIHEIVQQLAASDYNVLIRPHPEFIKRNKRSFEKLLSTTRKQANISLDTNPSLWNSLLSASHLVTDRSGIAFEYAFVKQRPVIFIDTPHKIQNKNMQSFKSEPVENKFRDDLGIRIHPKDLNQLLQMIDETEFKKDNYAKRINSVKPMVVFDASFNQDGIDYINEQLS